MNVGREHNAKGKIGKTRNTINTTKKSMGWLEEKQVRKVMNVYTCPRNQRANESICIPAMFPH